jgi:guanylate kinase
MMTMSSRVEIILENTPFPGAGQEIGGHRVIESMVDVEGKNWAVYIKGKLSQSQVKSALASMTATHFALPVQEEFSLISFKPKGMTHARTNPPGDVTVVRGHMYYARPNPISKSAFHEEMDEMLIDNPEKHFTKYTVKSTDALHERLWKGVSYAGESYGWKKGDELWHRRASFIMPKIKINKALKGATMFYHTHPSKDEPSLTSADDIQFYLDLHFAWGIKSFYTVMKHKLDHFTITGKPGGAEKYLRMEEDAFIDTVDGMIGKGEEVAKKEVGDDRPEVEFQNRITREMVDLFNKKFKSIAKISFRPKAKNTASKLARKPASNPLTALVNPAPNPPIKVKDQYVAKALEELKGLDYAHEHYGADEYGHTMYVYWWLKHHLAPTDKQPKGRLFKLNEYGLDSDTRKKLRSYLSQPIIGNYNYMDAVYLLALYHDIAKLREKGVKEPGWEIGAEMFRNEIGPELNLPSKLTEDLAFLFDTDLGRKGIADEDFLTQSGDYYGASKLVQMADMITHHPTMYTKKGGQAYKQEAMVSMVNQLRVFLDHHYVIQNPPPQVNTLQWVSDYGIEDIPYGAAEELLGEFHQSVIPDNDGKTKQPNDKSSGGHIYYMRFNNSVIPGLSRTYSANLALSSSKLTIFVGSPTPDDLGKKVANDIYQLVGSKLQESYFEIELEVPAPEVLVNPRHANKIQIISISGPSGGGKSTLLRYLSKHIPNSSTPPTYTTRPQRRSDGPDRKFVSKTQFKSMLKRGEFVEYTVSANGHYYGRRFKDFLGNVAIIEVSLQGKKDYEKRFANMFTVYLDPDPKVTEEQRAKDIFKRGGLTKEEAKRRAKKATELVEKSKKMQFDLRVTMMKGKYNEGAKKVLSEVPLVNSRHTLDVGITPEEQEAANRAREQRKAEAAAEAAELAEQFPQDDMDVGITQEEQAEADRLLAENKERIAREAAEEAERIREYEESLIQDSLPITTEEQELEDELEEAYRDMHDDAPWANPKKDLFDWFEDWAKLINMKNKELKSFPRLRLGQGSGPITSRSKEARHQQWPH